MKKVQPQESWPALWRECYFYDLAEIYGQPDNLGYANAYANRRAQTLRMVEQVVRPGASILDVAAAQGNFTLALAEKGYRVTWNDLRSGLVDYVKQKHDFGDVRYTPGNVFELSFDEPFDAVLITEIIEHVAHPDDFLRQVSQLVRPGGHIIMTTPNGAYFKNQLPKFSDCADPSLFESGQFKPNADGHIFLLHPTEIRALAEQAGLEVVELRLFTNPLTTGHLKTESLLRVLPKSVIVLGETMTAQLPEALRARMLVHTAALFRVR
jgi:2-polyprenyl-3-methyl-5-hydroxy-6-metoxy-1,4-benzoquinol methylase